MVLLLACILSVALPVAGHAQTSDPDMTTGADREASRDTPHNLEEAAAPGTEQGEDHDSSACPFCRASQAPNAFLCTSCGRLFRTRDLDPATRFWGDAFYIFSLPTITSRPQIRTEVGPDGLIRETVEFDLGDRYEYEVTKKGVKISGRIRAVRTNEVKYTAEVLDEHDEVGHLVERTVHGQLDSKPKRFLYRRIEYRYNGNRIVDAKVGSWIYAKGNDWEKRPAEWLRHNMVEFQLEYTEDALVRVHVARRRGVRDLRGNAEYAPEERFTEVVSVASGLVTGFGRPQIEQ